MPGMLMGFISADHILWVGVPLSVVEYCVKYVGTVFMAFGSGLATSYAAYLIEKLKTNTNVTSTKKRRKGDRAA